MASLSPCWSGRPDVIGLRRVPVCSPMSKSETGVSNMETDRIYGRLSLTNGYFFIGLPLILMGLGVLFILNPAFSFVEKPFILFVFFTLAGVNVIMSFVALGVILFGIYRLEMNPDGFQEHGVLRTRFIRWEDCDGFRSEGFGDTYCVLRNGKRHSLSLFHGRRSKILIPKLNAYRERALAAMRQG